MKTRSWVGGMYVGGGWRNREENTQKVNVCTAVAFAFAFFHHHPPPPPVLLVFSFWLWTLKFIIFFSSTSNEREREPGKSLWKNFHILFIIWIGNALQKCDEEIKFLSFISHHTIQTQVMTLNDSVFIQQQKPNNSAPKNDEKKWKSSIHNTQLWWEWFGFLFFPLGFWLNEMRKKKWNWMYESVDWFLLS